jgi:hypothetical protein
LEYDSVDWGEKRRALDVMLEFVAAALGGATEFASPDLGLGASRRDPRVAPSTEHTGGNGGGGGFGEVDGFLKLVVWNGSFFACFVGVREESVNWGGGGGIALARLWMNRVVLSHLDVAAWADPFTFGSALDNSAPRGARYGLSGFGEIVDKGGLDPPAVIFSWLVVVDSKVGHWAFFLSSFLEVRPIGLPGASDFGRPYQGSS